MCMMEHYGNCDEGTKENEYCIFHRPDKNKTEAAEFYRRFLNRFKPRVEETEAGVKMLVFERFLDCRGFVFPGLKFDFAGALFKCGADFSNAVFEGSVDFRASKFFAPHTGETAGAPYDLAYIIETNAKRWYRFKDAVFKKEALFNDAIFHAPVSFEGASFLSYTDFSTAVFWGKAIFRDAIFENDALFCCSIFRDDVDFSGTTFYKSPSFQAELSKPGDAGIQKKVSELLREHGSEFHGNVRFSNINLLRGIMIDLPSELFKLPEAEIEARRVQRLSYEKEGKREEADRMFVLEMRAKRRLRLKNSKSGWERFKARFRNFIEWLLTDLSSEYGTNWIRLFAFSLAVIIGNAIPYTVWGGYLTGFSTNASLSIRFANALYYSVVTFTTLGYGDMRPTGWLKALSAIEALSGAVFMALIVAVIARKWMR